MGWLGKLDAPEKLISAVGKGVDKFFDGQGDKAERFTELLKLYEPFKIAQRYLAFMTTGTFLFIHLITALLYISVVAVNIYNVSELNPEPLKDVFKWNNDNLLYIVMIQNAFYFSGGVINGAIKRFSNKK